jgi:hypothetical protein
VPLKPFVEFDSIPSDISMRRPRHLQVSSFRQDCTARIRTREGFFDLHFRILSQRDKIKSHGQTAWGPAVVETINPLLRLSLAFGGDLAPFRLLGPERSRRTRQR